MFHICSHFIVSFQTQEYQNQAMNCQPITSNHHLPTIRENETLRLSISRSNSVLTTLKDEVGIKRSSLQMPDCNRPENISKTFGGGNLDTVQAYQNIVSLLVDCQKYEEALEVGGDIQRK